MKGQFPAVFSLTNLNGQNGFIIDNDTPTPGFGSFGSIVGDVNADGYNDLLIWGSNQKQYVIFGSLNLGSSPISLSALNGTNGFSINTPPNVCYSNGKGLSDINLDGYDDFAIGCVGYNSNQGRVYVIYGGPNLAAKTTNGVFMSIDSLGSSDGFILNGELGGPNNNVQFGVIGVTDMNVDGHKDLIIGSPSYNFQSGGGPSGRVYVIFASLTVGTVTTSNLNGINGFKIDGYHYDNDGVCVSLLGDMNGDGYGDLAINGGSANAQSAYVVFGGPGVGSSGNIALGSLNGMNGGFSLGYGAWAGGGGLGTLPFVSLTTNNTDFNGDGFADFLIGAGDYPPGKGSASIVWGRSNITTSLPIIISNLNGANGITVSGEQSAFCDYNAVFKDINGDGYNDFIAGHPRYNSNLGRQYVFFGGPGLSSAHGKSAVSYLNGANGFIIDGDPNGGAGYPVVLPSGDLNKDGLDDILIGAQSYNSNQGRIYVLFGDSPPVIVSNTISLGNGQTITLDSNQLSAYDLNHANNSLIFVPSNITHGYFQLATQPGLAIANFTQQQIGNNVVQFVHDGNSQTPSYNITVKTSGIAWTGPQAAQVTLNQVVFQTPTLTIHQGETVLMSPVNLNVTDTYNASQVNFNITNVQHGQFLLLPLNNSVTQFTQQQVQTGQVLFQQDGSPVAPVYTVTVSDPGITTAPKNATIVFYRQPDLQLSALTLHQNQTVPVGNGEWNVTDDYPANQVMLIISGLQHGQFVLSNGTAVTQLTEQQLAASNVTFVHDGSSITPSYQVTLSDPYFTLPAKNASVVFYPGPVLQAPTLTIHQNETRVMTSNEFAATVSNVSDPIVFKLSNIQHGYFVWPNGTLTTQFTPQQLQGGEITFVHDGSSTAPNYTITVSDPYVVMPSQSATVTFYPQPVLQPPMLTMHQNETRVMTSSSEFAATDVDPADPLTFTISGLQQGQLLLSNGTVVMQFTQQQLQAGEIRFVHDGSSLAPSYLVTLSNPYVTLPAQSAVVTFYPQPTLQAPTLVIHQNETRVMTSGEFKAMVSDVADPITFTVSDVQQGHFTWSNGTLTTQFTSQQLQAGEITFVHDGSAAIAPSYDVTLSDPYVILPSQGVVVTFYPQPTLQPPTLTIHQNETRVMTDNELAATDADGADPLTFTMSGLQHGQWRLSNGTVVIQFTQQQLQAGEIRFVHDGSNIIPSYNVTLSNPYVTLPSQSAVVTFYPQPTLQPPTLTFHQNETRVMTSSELKATVSDVADPITFTVSDVQHGHFMGSNGVQTTQFTPQELQAGEITFVHDGSSAAPNYTVTVSDPYVTVPSESVAVTFYPQPTLQPPTLTFHQNETRVMTGSEFKATVSDIADPITFTVSDVQHGHFMGSNGTLTTQFTPQELQAGEITFVHDGSSAAPNYTVTVSDPYITVPSQSAVVTFYPQPTLQPPMLIIHQNETRVMTSSEFKAMVSDVADPIMFTVSNVQQGDFIWSNDTLVTQFTPQQLQAGEIRFVHDGSSVAPSYNVTLSDPYVSLPSQSATITFYSQPILQPPQLTIHQNETRVMTGSEFAVMVSDISDPIKLTVSGMQHGHFIGLNGTLTTQFMLQELQAGKITFVHDGSNVPPSYNVTLNDPYVTLPPQSAGITFYPQPTLQPPTLIIHRNETHVLKTSELPILLPDPSDPVVLIVRGVQRGQFQLANGSVVTQFSEQALAAGNVRFVHDGSTLAPGYNVSIRDPHITSPEQSANVTFYLQPGLYPPMLTIHQNETRVIGSDELSVTYTDPSEPVLFKIDNLQHGQFILPNGTAAWQLTPQQLLVGDIRFIQDGSNVTPSYEVSLIGLHFVDAPLSAQVTFYPQPTLQPPTLTIHQNETRVMTSRELNATASDVTNPITWTVSNVQHGRFIGSNGALTMQFTPVQLQAGMIRFVHDGSGTAPSYTVTVSDPYITVPSQSAVVTFYPQPTLQPPTLTIHQNETRVMTSNEFAATVSDVSDPITFTLGGVQHGHFTGLNGILTMQFTRQALQAGEITFVHDGSSIAPSYTVTLSDPYVTLPSQSAGITFYPHPTLQPPTLTIHQNETRVMTRAEFNVTRADPADLITFVISNLTHGRLVLPSGVSVEQFTEQALTAGNVTFIQDGSTLAPSYEVSIHDPYYTLDPVSSMVTFYRRPVLQPPTLTLVQSESIVMNSAVAPLILSNEDYPLSEVNFTLSHIASGYVTVDGVNQSSPVTFTAEQLQTGTVVFHQDESTVDPQYDVSVGDPFFQLPAVTVNLLDFHKHPVLIKNDLTIQRRGTVVLGTSELEAEVNQNIPDTAVEFTVMNVDNAYFIDNSVASHPRVNRFNQAKVKGGYIQFYHAEKKPGDSIHTMPSYCVNVTDGLFTVGPACASIQYDYIYENPVVNGQLPDRSYEVGQTFTFPVNTSIFEAQNAEALSYSISLAGTSSTALGISFLPPNTITGSSNQVGNFNISVTATGTSGNGDLPTSAVTYFLLTIVNPAGSFFADAKSLGSTFGSVAGVMFGGFVYLYGRYYFSRKRELDHPFANEVHQRLNLSYVDFSDKEGREYRDCVMKMLELLKEKTGVDMDQLEHSNKREDRNLYYYYVDLFTDVICKKVRMISVYCGLSNELRLRDLHQKSEEIVNEVIVHARRAPPERIIAAGKTRWCGFFADLCCASRRSRRLSVIEETELTGMGEHKEDPTHPEEKSPHRSGLSSLSGTPTGDRSTEPSTSRKNLISEEIELETLSSPPGLELEAEPGREGEATENMLLIKGETPEGVGEEGQPALQMIPRPSRAISPGPRLFNPHHLGSPSANSDSLMASSTATLV
jgi:hypothetical protein